MFDPQEPQLQLHLASVEFILDHTFHSRPLLLQSLTHSSYANEFSDVDAGQRLDNNERLEFLGDAVIGLVVARVLMERYPGACEGRLSRWRSSLVSRKTLAEIAGELELGKHLLLGRGELRTGGPEKRSILAAGLEAIVGALYIDAGLEKAEAFLVRIYSPFFDTFALDHDQQIKLLDQKTHLQERIQSVFKTTPIYRLLETWGPEHEKHFRVEIVINQKAVARGEGRSKKDAEQEAAGLALRVLDLL